MKEYMDVLIGVAQWEYILLLQNHDYGIIYELARKMELQRQNLKKNLAKVHADPKGLAS